MQLQQLRYVVALSQEKHFGRAGRRAHVSQPTLSQQLKKLEDELGVALFERAPRHVRLTLAGEHFLPHAIQTLDTINKGIEELQALTGKTSGKIRVAAIPTISPYVLPSVIQRFRKRAPKVVLELYEDTTSVLLENLKNGIYDIGILALPINEAGIASLSLHEEMFYLAVNERHPLASKRRINPKDLADERVLILQEGHCFRDQSLEYCKKASLDPNVIFQGSSLTSVMKLAAAGEGVTFVPKMATPVRGIPKLKCIPFSSPVPRREVGIIWRLSAPLSRAHNLLIETVEEVLKRQRNI